MSYNPQNANGQATSASSAPVVIASDQSAVAVSAASLPLPTLAATSTKQSDGSQKTQVVDGSGNVIGSTTNALDVNVKSSTTLTVGSHAVTNAGTFAVQAAGDVASGAADSGNPVKIGGLAKTVLPTAVSDGQRVNALFTKTGKAVSIGALREHLARQNTTITSSTAETTIITSDATYFLDVYGLVITNTSASNCEVQIRDATGGTVRYSIQVPAADTRGFMVPVDSATPQTTVSNNWTATCISSVASIKITAMYVKNL